MAEIKTIQFKRGRKVVLEAKLTASELGVLLAGEPAFETDAGGLKIGDGITDYINLPYITGGGSGQDSRFVIQDPVADQVLLYDDTLGKWVNKDLFSNESIIYLAQHGLTIKGYDQANNGQMPVKDSSNGIIWVTPVSTATLDEKVGTAQAAAVTAQGYAQQAANSLAGARAAADEAALSEYNADRSVKSIPGAIDKKLQFMTIEEYNNLEEIEEDCYYFLTL